MGDLASFFLLLRVVVVSLPSRFGQLKRLRLAARPPSFRVSAQTAALEQTAARHTWTRFFRSCTEVECAYVYVGTQGRLFLHCSLNEKDLATAMEVLGGKKEGSYAYLVRPIFQLSTTCTVQRAVGYTLSTPYNEGLGFTLSTPGARSAMSPEPRAAQPSRAHPRSTPLPPPPFLPRAPQQPPSHSTAKTAQVVAQAAGKQLIVS